MSTVTFEFENRLKELIVLCRDDITINDVNENTNLVTDFVFGSFEIIQLVTDIENAFGIEFDEEDLLIEKLSSYASLVLILENKLKHKIQEN